ncbi:MULTISPECIES: ABC-F family ATP-binding cassette domain-containing protein [Anaerostipes]|uniref:ABC-F family ATP-binding cassette domain-containing protein n=1 Tax=Anaerostipes TaxID=207244 RepID=UPI000951B68F|nr:MULTISPECIES: ABC-F family ATP-binding cassette domain-containing protein [Anaerostipes]MCI5623707.1 ABC-F family ATP-binding cassette domain-containing protein [Anaerostipes sp.]MDY2725781.1 ABC-F family ATP-binding cassette domain-containing protein [Anaerostipes faecalis]OLR58647.1 ABC transporter [Anaerostipes sp. 494a]
MILSCQNICKTFVEKPVLQNISFHLNENDRLAIIGYNGAGKSTLLKILVGEISADDGEVSMKKDTSLGYLAQHQNHSFHHTIFDELLSVKQEIIELDHEMRTCEHEMQHLSGEELEQKMKQYTNATHRFEQLNGFAYKSEITGILKGLGFCEEDFQKQISTLSGGQMTRVALGKLLLKNPDVLLLDEPTNHLDVESIRWLENYLSHYNGAVIIVSHDRYFLDKIVNKVMEIELGKSMLFDGNYSQFIQKRDQIKAIRQKEYENQQQEIKHQQEVIKKLKQFNREKSIRRAESREKALNKMEILEKPMEYNSDMRLIIEPEVISGNDVLTLKDVKKSFGSKPLFDHISCNIFRGERVALIGPNGTGKTTLLKIICKKISKNSGLIQLGAGVSIGYYDQAQDNLDDSKTIFDEISDSYPDLTNTKIRNTLAAFLFYGEDVFRPISSLSGGEKGRVSLAKLMLSHANFLILDEPTNHLDIHSKEILESAMNAYTGTIFYVSHDRYFINKTSTRILEISDSGLTSYTGNYQDYLKQKEKEAIITADNNPAEEITESKLDWQQQKELQAKQRKKENRLKKVEEQITQLEERQSEIEEQMALPEIATDVAKLMELGNEQASITDSLEELYEEWETLC